MPYDLIDRIIEKQRADRENERKQVFSSLKEILGELAPRYDFSDAYIFGSVVRAGRFRRDSDVDIAVFSLKDQHFFRLMSEVSSRLERDVDLYQMERVSGRLRRKIEEGGVLWKRED